MSKQLPETAEKVLSYLPKNHVQRLVRASEPITALKSEPRNFSKNRLFVGTLEIVNSGCATCNKTFWGSEAFFTSSDILMLRTNTWM